MDNISIIIIKVTTITIYLILYLLVYIIIHIYSNIIENTDGMLTNILDNGITFDKFVIEINIFIDIFTIIIFIFKGKNIKIIPEKITAHNTGVAKMLKTKNLMIYFQMLQS